MPILVLTSVSSALLGQVKFIKDLVKNKNEKEALICVLIISLVVYAIGQMIIFFNLKRYT